MRRCYEAPVAGVGIIPAGLFLSLIDWISVDVVVVSSQVRKKVRVITLGFFVEFRQLLFALFGEGEKG